MAKKREEPAKAEPIEVGLAYEFPENMSVGAFANHMLVQRDEHDFHISFFQVAPPIMLGQDPEKTKQMLKSVPAKCVARIVVAEGFLPRVIQALQANLTKVLPQESGHNGKGGAHDKTA